MTNFLVAYDDNVDDLGDYLNSCYEDIRSYLESLGFINAIYLDGLSCNYSTVKSSVQSFEGRSFIFIGYSHGLSDRLSTSNSIYVSSKNSIYFTKSLFYSCACLTAKKLGPKLLEDGCFTFIGYKDKVFVNEKKYEIFIECKNSGIKYFLHYNSTIFEAFNYMKRIHLERIDELVEGDDDDFFAASSLNANLSSLVLLGNKGLKLSDL